MPMSLYLRILEDAKSRSDIYEVCLTGLGEPTLDPMLVDRVIAANGYLPKVPVGIYTNAVYLTPKLFDRLRDAGLDYVVVSLNASTAKQHEAVMGLKDKFEQVCSNADYAIRHGNGTSVEVRAVISKDQWTHEDAVRFLDRWRPVTLGGHGRLIWEGNWAGNNRTVHQPDPNSKCGRAVGQLYVLADGRVTTCCFDPTGDQVFGDLSKQTIAEVYGSEPYVAFRAAHEAGEAAKYAICAGCSRI